MGRRRTNLVPDKISAEPSPETLSKEKPEVMDKLLEDLIDTVSTEDNEVKTQEDTKDKEYNIISNKKEVKIIEPETFNKGERVKLKDNVKFDTLGRRIHNGIHNYVYTVRQQRDDGFVIIECLTIILTVKPDDIFKIN